MLLLELELLLEVALELLLLLLLKALLVLGTLATLLLLLELALLLLLTMLDEVDTKRLLLEDDTLLLTRMVLLLELELLLLTRMVELLLLETRILLLLELLLLSTMLLLLELISLLEVGSARIKLLLLLELELLLTRMVELLLLLEDFWLDVTTLLLDELLLWLLSAETKAAIRHTKTPKANILFIISFPAKPNADRTRRACRVGDDYLHVDRMLVYGKTGKCIAYRPLPALILSLHVGAGHKETHVVWVHAKFDFNGHVFISLDVNSLLAVLPYLQRFRCDGASRSDRLVGH